jgi:hypothetical protein
MEISRRKIISDPTADSNVEIELADVRIEPSVSTERPHLATIFRRSLIEVQLDSGETSVLLGMVYLFMFALSTGN